jgi:uncharacterized membrane protein YfcA
MGLLAIIMPPVEAAALLIAPSLLTNAWQTFAGPSLRKIVRRLWPMMVAVCLGTWGAAGFVSGVGGRYGSVLLGIALILYAATGLAAVRMSIARERETVLGVGAGVITGAITAATGVFVIPAVPYLQAIGLEKDELVQALGLSFTVSTLALAVNIALSASVGVSIAGPSIFACALACAGMWIGQLVRRGIPSATFRRCFFAGLVLLGLYLAGRGLM